MNPQESPANRRENLRFQQDITPANRRENQIQGPRPTPLRVTKDSHKIRKPPIAPKLQLSHPPPQQPPTGNQPVIIYSVSPKPIFVEASNFMSIVQRLTGRGGTDHPSTSNSGEVPVSPAARFAAIERTSPKEREERERRRGDMRDDELLLDLDVDASQMPGILSPAPGNLPVISAGMFSPVAQNLFGFSDYMMSPFMGSPSSLLFSGAGAGFTPSPGGEFFNIFDH